MTMPEATEELFWKETLPTASPPARMATSAADCDSPATLGTVTTDGPEEITRSTGLFSATSLPAAGFWLMTSPAGTVRLPSVLTFPTIKPAEMMADSAEACDKPMTSGTVTETGPAETTKCTLVKGSTSVPAAGVWLIT